MKRLKQADRAPKLNQPFEVYQMERLSIPPSLQGVDLTKHQSVLKQFDKHLWVYTTKLGNWPNQ